VLDGAFGCIVMAAADAAQISFQNALCSMLSANSRASAEFSASGLNMRAERTPLYRKLMW
jgi:hypothetical protein